MIQCSTPPSAATVSSPSDSPAYERSISSRRAPVARSIDQIWNRLFCWPATNRRLPTNVAPVMPVGGTAPGTRRTACSTAPLGAARCGRMSFVRYASRSAPADVHSSEPSGETSAHIALGISAGSSLT
jgi:hypothetical protein